jgi:hypothetical protein
LYRYRTGTVLVPAARYQLVQYEAPIQTVRAVRGRVLEPSVLVETLTILDDTLMSEDWNILSEYLDILAPLKEATARLEGRATQGNLPNSLHN